MYQWTRLDEVNEDEIKKQYYTIGEVARELDLTTSLIRFWETEFREINPLGLVPILRYRGRTITQSMAICEYLDDRCMEFTDHPATVACSHRKLSTWPEAERHQR